MTLQDDRAPARAPEGVGAPELPPSRFRHVTKADLLATGTALFAALTVAVCLRGLNIGSTLFVAGAAYVTFVVASILLELLQRHAQREVVAQERAAHRYEYVDLQDDTQDYDLDLTDARLTTASLGSQEPVEPDTDPSEDRPNRQRTVQRADVIDAAFSVVAALAIALVIRTIWGFDSPTGTVIWWYLAFLVVFYLLTRDRQSAEPALDRVVTVFVWSVGFLVTGILVWMLAFLFSKGLSGLTSEFFTEDLSKVGPLTPGGGAFHAIVGTIEQVGLATLIVVPIAVMTAVYLNEIQGRLATPVRFIVDAMSGLPSIVAGLLLFTVWVTSNGFSGASASAALIVLSLPLVTRASEEILRTVPDSLREASLALGAPQWRVVMRVVLPTARAGLVTAAILGVARMVGETAPVLLTAFGSDSTNWNPLSGQQADLPLMVWKLIRVPNATQVQRAWSAACVLVLLVLVLFVTARYITGRSEKKLGRSR
jgi:phosphate transport system permease protein